MNKHLLLALLFIPMAACGDANADTVGSGSDVTLKRYIIQGDDFPPNPDVIEVSPGKFENGSPYLPISFPVPAGSQVVKVDWVSHDPNVCELPSEDVTEYHNHVVITCDSELHIREGRAGYAGHYSIIIAY